MYNQASDWNFCHIARELEIEPWEAESDNPGTEIRRVWLGTIYGITPSGKCYAPFACSNVVGDCPVCTGTGTRKPTESKRHLNRAKSREARLCRGLLNRPGTWTERESPAGKYQARVARFRSRCRRVLDTSCPACGGLGSISAYRDERWSEEMERKAEAIGAFLDYQDESVFVSQCRDSEETETE